LEISYNIPKITKILNSVYNLFDIPVYFLSPGGKCIVGAQHISDDFEFCFKSEFIPELHQKCVSCDKTLCELCEKSHKPQWHLCHAGLYDGISPVMKDGILVGYVFFGHVKTDGSKCPFETEYSDICDMYSRIPYFPLDVLNSFSYVVSNINFDDCISFDKEKISDKEFEIYFYDKIIKYIENNIDKDLSISTVCNYFHISKSAFYKKWSQNKTMSFSNYVLLRRLNKAKKMIRETEIPLCKIAEMVGINNYSYFFSAFRKQIGMTPGQYRKRIN